MDFKVEWSWNAEKHCRPPVGREGKFLNFGRSRMAKTVIFWPWWKPFNSFCFETLSFFPFVFIFFATQKSWGGEEWGGEGAWSPDPPVSPALVKSEYLPSAHCCKTFMKSMVPSSNKSQNLWYIMQHKLNFSSFWG